MSDERFIPESWRGRPLITVEQLREGLPFHTDDLYRMAAAGQIPSKKIKGRRLFLTQAILAWLEAA
jgi:hypothetical protein